MALGAEVMSVACYMVTILLLQVCACRCCLPVGIRQRASLPCNAAFMASRCSGLQTPYPLTWAYVPAPGADLLKYSKYCTLALALVAQPIHGMHTLATGSQKKH